MEDLGGDGQESEGIQGKVGGIQASGVGSAARGPGWRGGGGKGDVRCHALPRVGFIGELKWRSTMGNCVSRPPKRCTSHFAQGVTRGRPNSRTALPKLALHTKHSLVGKTWNPTAVQGPTSSAKTAFQRGPSHGQWKTMKTRVTWGEQGEKWGKWGKIGSNEVGLATLGKEIARHPLLVTGP